MDNYIEEIPDFQSFRRDILPIFSDGELEQAHNALTIALNSGDKTVNGEPLTWEYIKKQFEAHHSWWNYQFKKTEAAGYLKETHRVKRLDIEQFIEKKAYNKDWLVHKGSSERDNYLFGKRPIHNLKAQLDAFREQINNL